MFKKSARRREWASIQKLVVCRSITSFDDYLTGVVKGEANARLTAISSAQPVPDIEYIQRVHREFFEHVHPWAGKFNEKGDDIWFGGMLSCNPSLIVQELEELAVNVRQMIGANDESKARAIAYFHAKFERIHPFKDGNGRVGRLLMESQIVALFGLPSAPHKYTIPEYFRALKRAQKQGNIRTLMNFVLRLAGRAELPETFEALPFRLRLRSGDPKEERLRRRAAKNRN